MAKFGSLQNLMMGNSVGTKKGETISPEIGMGGTLVHWTDREPVTIIEISPSGKTITLQADIATRLDKNGMSDSQSYSFERNPGGAKFKARKRKSGFWTTTGGERVMLGHRSKYYDYSF